MNPSIHLVKQISTVNIHLLGDSSYYIGSHFSCLVEHSGEDLFFKVGSP